MSGSRTASEHDLSWKPLLCKRSPPFQLHVRLIVASWSHYLNITGALLGRRNYAHETGTGRENEVYQMSSVPLPVGNHERAKYRGERKHALSVTWQRMSSGETPRYRYEERVTAEFKEVQMSRTAR